MVIELYLVSIGAEGAALVMGKDPEHAVSVYRQNNLGAPPTKEVISAQRAATAPFDLFMRTAMMGLYSRLFQADMAQRMQG